jgi:prepilin-type N-terminal cleavage/methylation domain-containing protein
MRLKIQSGFTLIEIMIAMAILAVITMLSVQTMKAGIQDREAVANEIASDSKVSDAMRIMRNDINSAYHYRDIFITVANNAEKPDPKPGAAQPTTPTDPAAPPPPVAPPAPGTAAAEPAATPRPIPPDVTGFIGDGESMYFTTLSNERTLQDSLVSDQAKIGYYVKGCRSHNGKKSFQVKCLYRSISPYLDEEVDKPGDETILLENVTEFKLRYVGPSRTTSSELEFVDAWKTGKNGDAITKDNFPFAVEVSLVTENKEDKDVKKVTSSALIPLRFPNNPPKKADGTPGSNADATTQPGGAPGSFNQGLPNQTPPNPPGPGGTR